MLQSITRLPIILKGILKKEDAELAVKHNVQGIIVSNHGGRQLDEVPASVSRMTSEGPNELCQSPLLNLVHIALHLITVLPVDLKDG